MDNPETKALVLEAKYQVIRPPLIASLSKTELRAALNEYKRYSVLRAKDKLEAQGLRECLSEDLKAYLEWVDEGSQGEKILDSDEHLQQYLDALVVVDSAEELVDLLSKLQIDMSITDPTCRIRDYNMRFIATQKRATVTTLKDSVLFDTYLEGLKPKAVRESLRAKLSVEKLAGGMRELMSLAEAKVIAQDDLYSDMQSSKREKERGDKDTVRKEPPKRPPPPVTPQKPASSPAAPPELSHSKPLPHTTQSPAANKHGHDLRKDRKPGVCYHCNGKYYPGHNLECPKNPNRLENKNVNLVEPAVGEQKVKTDVPAVMLPVMIGGAQFSVELDTGAAVSCITQGMAQALTEIVPVEFSPSPLRVVNANGVSTPTRFVTFDLELPSVTSVTSRVSVRWTFAELANTSNRKSILLGRDLQKELGILGEDGLHLNFASLESREQQQLAELDDGIPDDCFEAVEVHQTAVTSAKSPSSTEELEREVMKVMVPEGPFGERIRGVLRRHAVVFDTVLPPEGADFPPFHIDLIEDKITHVPPRRYKPGLLDKARAELLKLRDMGVIRDAHTAWRHAAVLVESGGKVRVCGDYKPTNENTKPLHFPLPLIGQMLQILQHGRFKGKMDARKGFHQLTMAEEDICKTAIGLTDDWVVEYPRLPFGVKNGPMWYQMQMTEAYAELLYKTLGIYIDDFLFADDTEEGFLDALDRILAITEKRRLRLSAEKCQLGFETVEAIGFVCSPEGRRVSEERVKAIHDIPAPRNVHELRSFLGAMMYFHEFVPGMSGIAEPLNKLLGNKAVWAWTDVEQAAFEQLKFSITSEDVLAYGTEEGELVLRTDASSVGIGGVLLLRTPKGDKPITYFSKSLSSVQRRWSTIEQELYAIVYGLSLKPYHDLLLMREFTIETDHRNLIFLDKLSPSNPKLMRWRLHMTQYPFKIKHIAGRTNSVADALSRLGHDEECEADACKHEDEGEVGAKAKIKVYQLDVDMSEFDARLREAQRALGASKIKELDESSVYDADTDLWYNRRHKAIITDAELCKELLAAGHGRAIFGHVGVEKTVDAIEEAGYSWPTIYQDVRRYVKRCGPCQKMTHRLDNNVAYLLKTTMAHKPFAVLSIDTVGPLPDDSKGFRYILVMMDAFTRYVELAATATVDADECAEALMNVFMRHGVPREVRSDNGTQFVNQVVDALLKKLEVHHHRTLPYHPEANGLVERVNQEVMKHLRCFTLQFEAKDRWSSLLPIVQHVINETVHSAIGVSPHDMLYGRVAELLDPLAPFRPEADSVLERWPEEFEPKNYVEQLTKNLGHIHAAARRLQEQVVSKRMDKANHGKEPTKFKVGDLVFYLAATKTPKLSARQSGPYKIIELNEEKLTYHLQSLIEPEKVLVTHPSRMCKFEMPDDAAMGEIERMAAFDEEEFMVSAITGHVGSDLSDLMFQVVWTGYEDTDPEECWEPYLNVKGNSKLEEYISHHPEVLAIVRPTKTRPKSKSAGKNKRR